MECVRVGVGCQWIGNNLVESRMTADVGPAFFPGQRANLRGDLLADALGRPGHHSGRDNYCPALRHDSTRLYRPGSGNRSPGPWRERRIIDDLWGTGGDRCFVESGSFCGNDRPGRFERWTDI